MDFNIITDTPKTNTEMLLNHIYAKDGKVCIRTFEKEDIDLCELCAKIAQGLQCCSVDADELRDGACFECDFEMCCVGLFYRAAIEAAEMREILKKELALRNIQNNKESQ